MVFIWRQGPDSYEPQQGCYKFDTILGTEYQFTSNQYYYCSLASPQKLVITSSNPTYTLKITVYAHTLNTFCATLLKICAQLLNTVLWPYTQSKLCYWYEQTPLQEIVFNCEILNNTNMVLLWAYPMSKPQGFNVQWKVIILLEIQIRKTFVMNLYTTRYVSPHIWQTSTLSTQNTGLILGLHPANERRHYFVTTSLIGWEQTYNQPCNIWTLCLFRIGMLNQNLTVCCWCQMG